MRIFILILLSGLAAADLIKRAEPYIDQAVISFYRGANDAGSLSEALGTYDPVVQEMADNVQIEIGKLVKEAFKDFLEKVKDQLDKGKTLGKQLLEKLKELRNKLKELGGDSSDRAKELMKEIQEKAKETLKKIFENLRKGNDDALQAVGLNFREIVEKIKEKILSDETIQKIREYIQNIYAESPLLKKIKAVFEKLRDSDIREIIKHLLEYRPEEEKEVLHGETWDKIKEFFRDLKIKIKERYMKFGEWVTEMWGKGIEKMKDKYGLIKSIAMEFIADANNLDGELIREALEFFKDHQDELGSLWKDIVEAAKKALGKS